MAIPESEHEARLEKLKILQAQHINPYPSTTKRSHEISKVLDTFEELTGKRHHFIDK